MQSDKKSTIYVGLILSLSCMLVMGIALEVLYKRRVNDVEQSLVVAVQSQARLIEAVARYDSTESLEHPEVYQSNSLERTIDQIKAAHELHDGFCETGEFTIARIRGESIEFILRHAHDNNGIPPSIALNSEYAEPMRRALQGLSGVTEGLDYRGVPVLAAYEPVNILNIGIVAKIDMSEVQAPFYSAIVYALLSLIVVVFLGVYLVTRALRPLLNRVSRQAQETEHFNNVLLQVIESVPLRVFWKDLNLKYMGCNSQFARDAGFSSSEELLGRSDFEMGWKDQAELYRSDDQEVIQSCSPKLGIVEPQTTPNGDTIWLRTSKVPLQSSNGAVWGILGLYEDITLLKRAEEQLRESEEKFRLVSLSAHDAIIMLSAGGRVEVWNNSAEKMFGYSNSEAHGKLVHDLITPEHYRSQADNGLIHFARTGTGNAIGKTVELTARKKDGKEFPVELSLSAVNRSGKWCAVATIRDVTERKQAEEARLELEKQLRQTQKLETIGTLAGGIAHDFNNLLVPIMAYTEMLISEHDGVSETKTSLMQIRKAAVRAKDLVSHILTFSRNSEHPKTPTNIEPTIIETLAMFRPIISDNINIEERLDAKQCLVEADATQIQQVVMNLLTNAVHAVQNVNGKPIIEVGLKQVEMTGEKCHTCGTLIKGQYLCLSVKDNGSGISTEARERLFEPFFTTKEVGQGTGLGLSVVLGIVKAHKGHIIVSAEQDKGSEFCIYFPLMISNGEVESNAVTRKPNVHNQAHILLVDDEASVRNACEQVLKRNGFIVKSVESSTLALDELRQTNQVYDLVLTDFTMPGSNGFELARQVRSNGFTNPILLMTGNGVGLDMDEWKNCGIYGIVSKPMTTEELIKQVNEAISSPVMEIGD